MKTTRSQSNFKNNFEFIDELVSKSKVLQQVMEHQKILLPSTSFTQAEIAQVYATFLSQFYTGVLQIVIQTSQGLEISQAQSDQALKKGVLEIESMKEGLQAASMQNQLLAMQAKEAKIKAFSIAKSANDNALINKAQIFLNYMQIVGNAKQHAEISREYEAFKRVRDAVGSDNAFKYHEELNIDKNIKDLIILSDKLVANIGEDICLFVISNTTINKYLWEYDGGKFSNSPNPIISFNSSGAKIINFTATTLSQTEQNTQKELTKKLTLEILIK